MSVPVAIRPFTLSHQQILQIVERSAFLRERMEGRYEPVDGGDADNETQRRMEEWKQTVAAGDPERFARRLSWVGLSAQDAVPCVGEVRLRTGHGIPEWTDTLQSYLARGGNRSAPPCSAGTDPDEPIAFEQLLTPLVALAADRVIERTASAQPLQGQPFHVLQRSLLKRLSMMAGKCFYLAFSTFRSQAQMSTGMYGHWPGIISRALYDNFVDHMLGRGLAAFFIEYPVLARYLTTAADLWVDSTAEFVNRLKQDAPLLSKQFEPGVPLGDVVDLKAGLSDFHKGGRSAILVCFASGLEVFYKPKPLRSEQLYYELLDFLRANGATDGLASFRVLNRGEYGWAERIPNTPCETPEQVTRYFHRAGMLICVLFMLEGADCHYENIVASGEYPALVDMESLLHHRVPDSAVDQGPWSTASRVFFMDSVFRTGLLPRWEFDVNGEGYDLSGLGGIEIQSTSILIDAWEQVNTDAMRLNQTQKQTSAGHNVVVLHGNPIAPSEYAEAVVDGFQRMYDLLRELRQPLFHSNGPLPPMREMPVRFLYRHTRVYSVVLKGIFSPQYLRNGADAGIRLDILSRPLLYENERNPYWDLFQEELRALEAGDIPVFYANAGSAGLAAGSAFINGAFAKPSYETMRERFESMSDAHRDRQIAYIRSAFLSGGPDAATSRSTAAKESDEREIADLTALFIEEALRIANVIRDAAIISSDGCATWISIGYFPENQRYQMQPMSPHLFDGSGGVAVFLAALAKVTGNAEFRDLANRAVRTIQYGFSDPLYEQMLFHAGPGSGVGGTSPLYALVVCSRLLGTPELLTDAERLFGMVKPERLQNDVKLDLISGVAGVIVSLLAYYRATGDQSAVDMATVCGDRLIACRTEGPNGYRAWPTLERQMLSGFSHGAAGIAYSLVRLYEASGDKSYLEAAIEGCAYENTLFDSQTGNWSDLRHTMPGKEAAHQCSWCHGAPGIALGRALSAVVMRNRRPEPDLEDALRTTLAEPVSELDQMCCGNLGRADILLEAGRVLGRPELIHKAADLAVAVTRRGHRTGEYGLGWKNVQHIPSFHQGMSGIGYALLRQVSREDLPCVLAWN